jgi:C-8 sterol isomerase
VAYVFDPESLHEIIRDVVGQPMETLLPELVGRLHERYPGHIETELRWLFNNAGGAMGAMTILHGSVTEYLLVFGTPIGTEGHTGRFWADDFFFILEGEQWAYTPGDLRRQVFRPGDMHHLPRGVARGYRIPEHCWALEYARGAIPSMLPFGMADALSSTLDWRNVGRMLKIYAASAVRQLARGKI